MIFLILSSISWSQGLPGEEIWVAAPTEKVVIQEVQSIPKVKKKTSSKSINSVPSNLPNEYLIGFSRESTASELVQPPKGSTDLLTSIRIGDILNLSIPHSIIAFPDEKAPVIGQVSSGSFGGYRFIGESYLERNSKRIFVNFTKLILGQKIYELRGVAVSDAGQPGLTGEYHSREAEYFAGDFLASFAAGYFDGLVPRQTNVFGQIESDTSVDSAVKKGLASGALSTAERFREKLKRVPEFSELKGPLNLKILILDQVKTTN